MKYLKLYEARKKTDDIFYHLAVSIMNFLSLEMSNLEIKYYKSIINVKYSSKAGKAGAVCAYIKKQFLRGVQPDENLFQLGISGREGKDTELREIVKKYYLKNRANLIDNSRVYELIEELDLLTTANKYNL